MEKLESKSVPRCSKNGAGEFIEMLSKKGEEISEILTDEAMEYLVEQIEALERIDDLEKGAREHAHYLLTMKDKETKEFKYTPKEVFDLVSEVED